MKMYPEIPKDTPTSCNEPFKKFTLMDESKQSVASDGTSHIQVLQDINEYLTKTNTDLQGEIVGLKSENDKLIEANRFKDTVIENYENALREIGMTIKKASSTKAGLPNVKP